MKQFTLFSLIALLYLFGSGSVMGQQYFEVGVQGGDMPYSGEINEPGTIAFLGDWNSFAGFYLRYRPLNRVGLRFNGIFGQLENERTSEQRISTDEKVPITRNFRTPITEFSLAAEVDLFYIGDPEDRFIAPYVMAGVGHTSFNPESYDEEGIYHELQPLRTEGQGLGVAPYDAAPYELSTITFHLGGGVRGKVNDRIVVGLEASGRLTGTDYLDDVSDTQLNYFEVRENTNTLGAQFSNPGIADPASVAEDFIYQRGGPANDYYFLINLTVGIRLGGWGRGGTGCYSF